MLTQDRLKQNKLRWYINLETRVLISTFCQFFRWSQYLLFCAWEGLQFQLDYYILCFMNLQPCWDVNAYNAHSCVFLCACVQYLDTERYWPSVLESSIHVINSKWRKNVPRNGEWAALGGSAIPRQPAERAKQASIRSPSRKNWSNSFGAMPQLELLHSKEQLFLLDLSQ